MTRTRCRHLVYCVRFPSNCIRMPDHEGFILFTVRTPWPQSNNVVWHSPYRLLLGLTADIIYSLHKVPPSTISQTSRPPRCLPLSLSAYTILPVTPSLLPHYSIQSTTTLFCLLLSLSLPPSMSRVLSVLVAAVCVLCALHVCVSAPTGDCVAGAGLQMGTAQVPSHACANVLAASHVPCCYHS